ncbi:hypothetical protein BgiMline_032646 [Biomphalaria glabrata]|nr:hypothetical protein BgiMline_015659 [Biomphalaria glabrata]
MKTRVTLLLLSLGFSLSKKCNIASNICSTTYVDRLDLQPVGCNETSMWTFLCRSKLSCAATCAANKTCAAFRFSNKSGTCSLCPGSLIQSLNFTSGQVISWKIQNTEKNWPVTYPALKYTNRSIAVPLDVQLGTVVHLYGYLYDLSGFNLDFRQDYIGNNITFHFRSRYDWNTYNPILVLNSCTNTVWNTESRPVITPFPFAANQTTHIHVLVMTSGYQVYINRTFCCSYKYTMSYADTKYLWISGYISVYEISA